MSAPPSIASFPVDSQTDEQDIHQNQTEAGHHKVETVSQVDVFRVPLLIAVLLDEYIVHQLLEKVYHPADEGEGRGEGSSDVRDK